MKCKKTQKHLKFRYYLYIMQKSLTIITKLANKRLFIKAFQTSAKKKLCYKVKQQKNDKIQAK